MEERTVILTAFDYEDEPGKEYLRITFDVKKEDIKDAVKSRQLSLGHEFIIIKKANQ